jgi:NADPH:quinone reductase-like Zn-dependent oxidoreductase
MYSVMPYPVRPFQVNSVKPSAMRGQTVVGLLVARVTEREPAEPQAAFDSVIDLYRSGRLSPEVTLIGPDDIIAAHERIETRRHVGKLVIDLTR